MAGATRGVERCQPDLVGSVIYMPRDLPIELSTPSESAVTSPKRMSPAPNPRHLSVISSEKPLTRGQVANRLGLSISTVRRFEGSRLHPTIDSDDVRWFDEREVASLAAELANGTTKMAGRAMKTSPASNVVAHSPGELAALVFERFEQRQSLAEIVIGLRVTPDFVRAMFDQWTLGLTEGQQRTNREPSAPRAGDVERVRPEKLAALLGSLSANQITRISVARARDSFAYGDHDFLSVTELGGFHVSGPCEVNEIVSRFGPGAYRVTAYGFEPAGIRWEILVEGLRHG